MLKSYSKISYLQYILIIILFILPYTVNKAEEILKHTPVSEEDQEKVFWPLVS
jgi:hypothetical protein